MFVSYSGDRAGRIREYSWSTAEPKLFAHCISPITTVKVACLCRQFLMLFASIGILDKSMSSRVALSRWPVAYGLVQTIRQFCVGTHRDIIDHDKEPSLRQVVTSLATLRLLLQIKAVRIRPQLKTTGMREFIYTMRCCMHVQS